MRIDVRVDLRGVRSIERAFTTGAGRSAIMEGLKDGAHVIQSLAQRSILSGPKTGRKYGVHRASAPGEAPANDTGTLVRGIEVRKGQEDFTYEVHSIADYAGYLEYGTSRMAPRPYLQPAAKKAEPDIVKLIAARIKGVV